MTNEPTDQLHREMLRLTLIPDVGPVLYDALIEHFGGAEEALAAPAGELEQVPGMGRKRTRAFLKARGGVDVDAELEAVRAAGVRLVARDDEEYPEALKYLTGPPPILYVRGRLEKTDGLAIAIVGSRRCSLYGRDQAERFATALARAGFTIVSGLARGIDSCAHNGALKVGGRTVAVLGNGLSNIYPPENKALAEAVCASGAVISEFPMATAPKAGNFPQRNRLLSGLSLGVLVIEAAERSGALITARLAAEQGKEVFALPGRVDSPYSAGVHRLIKTGAKLVHGLEDVLDEFPELRPDGTFETGAEEQEPAGLAASLSPEEHRLLGHLTKEPVPLDQLATASGMPPQTISGTLTLLELKGLVRSIA
ncbi:MAG: DNA-processing protein DprA, partial [Phycisphaerae bacterium]|nr:DNA-processing protein DprA [Phycisphaerae bacterium]